MHHENQSTGARIKFFREARGLSQEQLGEAVELTQQQIANYESGSCDIVLSRLVEITRVLQVSMHDLCCGGPGTVKTTPVGWVLSGYEKSLVKLARALKTDKMRMFFLAVAKLITEL